MNLSYDALPKLFDELLRGSVTGGADKTWTYTPPECTCTEEAEDPACPAARSLFCGYYTVEDDPSTSPEDPNA